MTYLCLDLVVGPVLFFLLFNDEEVPSANCLFGNLIKFYYKPHFEVSNSCSMMIVSYSQSRTRKKGTLL
ncbi:Uncharacterized protein TCM_030250 [Theobroma cacao]|uniref:Uncharacterized protein n=1 Tax=Theobroma cacao TaxID=3641 RepID=A0A061GFV9_THECC|nr:Uncharacterized protein TCM_030250 [Theobroma cacao]